MISLWYQNWKAIMVLWFFRARSRWRSSPPVISFVFATSLFMRLCTPGTAGWRHSS